MKTNLVPLMLHLLYITEANVTVIVAELSLIVEFINKCGDAMIKLLPHASKHKFHGGFLAGSETWDNIGGV